MRAALPGPRFSKGTKTLHRARGLVHDLIVTRERGMITLWSEAGIRHTVFDSAAPHLPGLEYARNMLTALAFCPRAQSCLILGLGGGSIPRMLLAARPQIDVEAVEIDPTVVELASKYFDIHALPGFAIHLEDAAAFLRRCTSRYGIVVVDTYVGEHFPEQCATQEFIANARKCMLDDGVIAINWLSGNSPIQTELLDNLESIIGPVWQLSGLRSRNLVYFATTRITTRPAIVSTAEALELEVPFENSLKQLAQRLRNPK
jgi:spermidine synthase